MNLFQTIVLSIIEGVTEFLPISSTGHLILASKLLAIVPTDFTKSFEIIIQLGAILAVVWAYKDSLLANSKYWTRILAGFIPSGIVGFVFYPFIKDYLLQSSTTVLWSLAVGGVVLIVIESFYKEKFQSIADLSIKTAFLIGLFQAVSVIPGVSRAAATIIGGLLLGLNRKSAVEFSFLLAIPTMLAASGWDLVQSGHAFTNPEIGLLGVGLVISFLTALVSIKFLLKYIKNHNFKIFGVYRIILAAAFGILT